jgi:PleD family two-component response regulator
VRNLDVKSIRVTSSFGVIWMDLPNMGVEDMVRCADEALYKAKATGRDRIYTPPPPTTSPSSVLLVP